MRRIQDCTQSHLRNARVVLRSDFDVATRGGMVKDDFRIVRALPTITLLRSRGARVSIISHINKKEGGSLRPVAEYLKRFMPIHFVEGGVGGENPGTLREKAGDHVIVFENLRRDVGEEKNEHAFAKDIASHGDLYVNDAFAVSHRHHASIVGVPKLLPSYAGLQFQTEIEELSKALHPKHPALLIIGGAKPETKVPLVQKFQNIVDHVFVAGVPANEYFKSRGYEIGRSSVSGKDLGITSTAPHGSLLLPEDVLVKTPHGILEKNPAHLDTDDRIVDVGTRTMERLLALVERAKTVIWNGPLGIYEEGFTTNTSRLAFAIAESGAYSIVGGGDTYSVIGDLRFEESFTFVSTAGGAMIDFLAHGTLPGIEALESSDPA